VGDFEYGIALIPIDSHLGSPATAQYNLANGRLFIWYMLIPLISHSGSAATARLALVTLLFYACNLGYVHFISIGKRYHKMFDHGLQKL